jgi:GTP-binding protein
MKIKSAVFDRSAPDLKSCPVSPLPEFAFIGRSNVGKSSLINLLAERKDLAKVSGTPGKTRLINFFRINDTWTLVDLPGYGYARIGQQERADFNEAVADFLERRENLDCVFVLIDSRLPPQRIDREFISWLESRGVPFALIFTKIDKQSAAKSQAAMTAFNAAVFKGRSELPPAFASSATTRHGRTEILNFIERQLANDRTRA